MNKTPFNKAVRDIQNISMTPAEKQAVLAHIREGRLLVAGNETRTPRHVRSPWTVYSFSSWIQSHRMVTVLAAFLIVAISSNSVVLAANESLPGDVLYTLKVNVAEPIRVALASGPVQKAEVQTTLVQTRFEEAETLAARGKLDDAKEKEISDLIDRHVADVSKNIEKVDELSSDDAEDSNIAVEASMNAHAKILMTIASNGATPQSVNAFRIADKAREDAKRFDVDKKQGKLAVADTSDAPDSVSNAPQSLMMTMSAPAPEPEQEDSSAARSAFTAPASPAAKMSVASVESTSSPAAVSSTQGTVDSPDVSEPKEPKKEITDDRSDQRDVSTGSSHTASVERTNTASTTRMSIESRKQKKEQEIYDKAKERLEKEIRREELRKSDSDKSDSDTVSNSDSDDQDDEVSGRNKKGTNARLGDDNKAAAGSKVRFDKNK